MHVVIAFIIGISLFSGFIPIRSIPETELVMPVDGTHNVKIRGHIKPLTEFQNDRLIKQAYDYSCGSSALATLLKFHFGEHLTEKQVIQGMLHYGDIEKIQRRRAFSLLDMKKFINKIGYQGVGYKAKIEDLMELDQPGIVPIKIFNYRHFTVLKGIHKGHIFLVDPWRGHSSYSLSQFQNMWYNNVIFIIYPPKGKATIKGLVLKEADLRFIDEDATYQLLKMHDLSMQQNRMQKDLIYDVQGEHQVYKN
ncbi:MAG: C39 family peptidase [Candidatus Magnetomorum sp.]|nr:C39 family peptidase [Candidatus Magnetomorum sp.]